MKTNPQKMTKQIILEQKIVKIHQKMTLNPHNLTRKVRKIIKTKKEENILHLHFHLQIHLQNNLENQKNTKNKQKMKINFKKEKKSKMIKLLKMKLIKYMENMS